jgi:hypothetical protein
MIDRPFACLHWITAMRLFPARALAAPFFVLGLSSLVAPAAIAADDTPTVARPVLSGEWAMNKSLSSAPGLGGMPDGGGRMGGRGGGRGPGGGGGGGYGGGMGGGRRGGMGGGGGMRGGGPGGEGRDEAFAAHRALMQEVMQLPARFTIAQDGDKLTFIEPDGVVRTYVANDKTEKHALTNGTIETKARWEKGALLMELKPSDGMKITRTFALRTDGHQLEVTTTFDRGPKDAKRVTVYDPPEAPAPAPEAH